jgi:hypothetical protein
MAFIVKRDLIVIPAGIPVAGTNSIIVNGEIYTKGYATFYYIEREDVGDEIFGCTSDCGTNTVQDAIVYRDGSWKFEINWLNGAFYGPPTNVFSYSYVSSTNPSTNSNFIPTAGWSPSITITAA